MRHWLLQLRLANFLAMLSGMLGHSALLQVLEHVHSLFYEVPVRIVVHDLDVVVGRLVVAHPAPRSLVIRVLRMLQVIDAAFVVKWCLRTVCDAGDDTFDAELRILFLAIYVLLQSGGSAEGLVRIAL